MPTCSQLVGSTFDTKRTFRGAAEFSGQAWLVRNN